MAAPETAESIVQERIEEVDVEKKGSSFHEATETEWRVLDNHRQTLSFSDVHPADITVRNLEVEVDVATPLADTFKTKFIKSRVGDVEVDAVNGVRRKKILKDVSADFPAGTLTAIIGGSGSGKVLTLHPLTRSDLMLHPLLLDDLPRRSLPPHAGIKSYYHRNCAIQRFFRPSHSYQRLCHTN